MIRINLLAGERTVARKKAPLQVGQKLTIGCSLIVIFAALFVAWRYWSLSRQSAEVDAQIASAQQEVNRLRSITQKVQEFEARKTQLGQRVALVDGLRASQTGPVHMLDQVSRSLPPMLWLTELKQIGNDVELDGSCVSETLVSDFVNNLEATGYFKRSIEIVSAQTQPLPQPPGQLIKFTLRATFEPPAAAAVKPPVAAAPAVPTPAK
jgi:type IV pilus assembly protein PilN